MTNKNQLAQELTRTGKVNTWEYYGKKYNMSAESARKVGQKLRWRGTPIVASEDNDFMKLYKLALQTAEELEHLQEVDDIATVNNYISELENKVVEYSENTKNGTATKTVETIEEVESLEDLIRVCKIDTEVWDITRYSQKSSNGKFTVEAFMSRKEKEIEQNDLRKSLLEEIKEYHENGRLGYQVVNLGKDLSFQESNEIPKKDQLLELAVFDLHLGKFSWKGETGEDYDMVIASKRYKECISELISRVDLSRIDRILLPLGNDMLHIDNKQKTTTGGTPQDTDTRYAKIFKTAVRMIANIITELELIAPVDVMIIPGNHDQTSMFTIGEVLDAMFMMNDKVTIYNDAKLRKYYRYGQNMIMFTHGSEEKHSDLGLIAATEMPQMWAETKYREVHLGHLHKSKSVKYTNVDEYQGFKVRIINSLSGTDAWHYSKGYMSLKGAEAFIWDYNKGLITNHFYNL